MADRQSETAPLLPHNVYNDELATPNNSRLMRLATVMSLVTGLLTLAFLVASMGIMSRAPSQYYPPYELYYSFAPIAGFTILAIAHSGISLTSIQSHASSRPGIAGILIDIFAGLYFLFQSLYGIQQLTYRGRAGCRPPYGSGRPVDPDCEAWRARAEPVFWCYLFVTLAFGIAHVMLLFLRASLWKRSQRELVVRIVGEDGAQIRVGQT